MSIVTALYILLNIRYLLQHLSELPVVSEMETFFEYFHDKQGRAGPICYLGV